MKDCSSRLEEVGTLIKLMTEEVPPEVTSIKHARKGHFTCGLQSKRGVNLYTSSDLCLIEKGNSFSIFIENAAHKHFEGMILEGFCIWMHMWVCSGRLKLMLWCALSLLSSLCVYQIAHISSTLSVFGSGYRTVCSSEWLSSCESVCLRARACLSKSLLWESASGGWLTVTSKTVSLGGAATREGSSPLHIWPCCYQSGLERGGEWEHRHKQRLIGQAAKTTTEQMELGLLLHRSCVVDEGMTKTDSVHQWGRKSV